MLRIFSRTLLAQRANIESAIKTLQTLAEGIDCGEGRLVLVAPADPDPDIPGARLALTLQRLEVESARLIAAALPQAERVLWPRFAVQISDEWLERQATEALLAALADDESVSSAGLSVVENAGTFIGVSARSAYAASSAVARAVGRAVPNIQDVRTGPAILVQ